MEGKKRVKKREKSSNKATNNVNASLPEKLSVNEEDIHFQFKEMGVIPVRDLKKNLGCG